jgi:acyl-coenzyme A synthetase/AMP-(fatty) acid ligase
MSKGLYAIVAERAALTPDAQALFDAHGSLTYSELTEQARVWAGAIAARGIGLGDRIAMLAPPGRESLICLLAADWVGAIWSGLDPRLRAEEIAFRLGDLTPKLVLTFETLGKRHYVDDMLAGMAATKPHIPLIMIAEHGDDEATAHLDTMVLAEFLAGAFEPAQAVPSDPARPAIIVYTSGSSGTPKGAMLSAPAMIDFAPRQRLRTEASTRST